MRGDGEQDDSFGSSRHRSHHRIGLTRDSRSVGKKLGLGLLGTHEGTERWE